MPPTKLLIGPTRIVIVIIVARIRAAIPRHTAMLGHEAKLCPASRAGLPWQLARTRQVGRGGDQPPQWRSPMPLGAAAGRSSRSPTGERCAAAQRGRRGPSRHRVAWGATEPKTC
jgi:hypothetical protein